MLYWLSNIRRVVFCGLILLMIGILQPALAALDRDRGRAQEGKENSRKEQLRQEAQQTASGVKDMLDQILESAALNKTPEKSLVTDAVNLLEENKRYMLAYEDEQKATYMLLQSWTDFYSGNLDGAMNWALRACKIDMTNGDAWISQSLFCMLNGKRPLEPRIRPQPREERERENNRRPRPRRQNQKEEENNHYASASEPYGRKGTLSFDLSALHPEMLKERFARLQYQAFSGSRIEYVPGEDTLCAFFWQVEPMVADANDLPGGPRVKRAAENRMMDEGLRYSNNNVQNLTPDRQGHYFRSLYDMIKENTQIACVAMNTNAVKDAEKIATGMDEDIARELKSTPMVFASAPASGAANYVGLDAQVPFMVIADKEGIVRYAGPAADFMPAFVLTHLTGVDVPITTSGTIQTPEAAVETQAPGLERNRHDPIRDELFQDPRRRFRQPDLRQESKRLTADPNQPADPNAIQVQPTATKTKAAEPVQMTLEDEIIADKWLELAREQIEACRTIRGKSPEQGIDACKKILDKYPGTEYAEKAREQLRRVPQRYWDKYGIEELLGY